jgi:hypothetical protein
MISISMLAAAPGGFDVSESVYRVDNLLFMIALVNAHKSLGGCDETHQVCSAIRHPLNVRNRLPLLVDGRLPLGSVAESDHHAAGDPGSGFCRLHR